MELGAHCSSVTGLPEILLKIPRVYMIFFMRDADTLFVYPRLWLGLV